MNLMAMTSMWSNALLYCLRDRAGLSQLLGLGGCVLSESRAGAAEIAASTAPRTDASAKERLSRARVPTRRVARVPGRRSRASA